MQWTRFQSNQPIWMAAWSGKVNAFRFFCSDYPLNVKIYSPQRWVEYYLRAFFPRGNVCNSFRRYHLIPGKDGPHECCSTKRRSLIREALYLWRFVRCCFTRIVFIKEGLVLIVFRSSFFFPPRVVFHKLVFWDRLSRGLSFIREVTN